MGTSKSNTGGTGGAWTGFKRNATGFAKYGGQDRAGKALAGYVAAMGGAAAATASAAIGARTGQSLARFLVGSTGPTGFTGGLREVGLERLVGTDRFTVLNGLVDELGGSGSDLEAQAARDALLDVLDQVLPEDEGALDSARLDGAAVTETLYRYIVALVYNRAIPIIDERLSQLENPTLARERDQELRAYIDALVRLRMPEASPLSVDWQGADGRSFIAEMLRAVYDQLES